MLLSHDYICLRTAVLTEDVINKLLQRYGPVSYTPDEIKKINLQIFRELPGKEDLVTEWFLNKHVDKRYVGEHIIRAKFFFDHYKEQLFKDVVREYNDEYDFEIDPKNLFDFDISILDEVRALYEEKVEAKTMNILPDPLPEGSQLFYDDGRYQIVRAFGLDAVCFLGKGTKWCTKEEQPASDYLGKGALFVFYRDKKKWALMSLGGDGEEGGPIEINGIKNKPLKVNDEMRNVLIESGFMDKILEKVIRSHDPESEFVRFVGNNPGPYMAKKCAGHPLLATLYAEYVIGGPFSAGEGAIARDPYKAMRYVGNITKRRFLEAEPLIMRLGLEEEYASLLNNVNPRDASEVWELVRDKRRKRDEDYLSYYTVKQ